MAKSQKGMELRGKALQTIPDRAVCFHLQYYPARGPCTPLARAEWRPLSPHTNPNVGKYPLLRIEGSHIHAFELNWLAELGRMRAGNLVIARPLNPDAATLDEFLAIVGKEFRIKNLNVIERPPWRLGDLFGI